MQIVTSSSPTSVRCKIYEDAMKPGIPPITPLDSSLHSLGSTSIGGSTVSSFSSSSSRKRVRFSPYVRAKDTLSRHDMTEDEITRSYLQQDEFEYIWEHNRRLLRRAKHYHSKGRPLRIHSLRSLKGFELDIERTPKGYYLCTRGLEGANRKNRKAAIEEVLEEQELQILEGFFDDELMAQVYMKASMRSTFKAVCLAMEDKLSATYEVKSSKQ